MILPRTIPVALLPVLQNITSVAPSGPSSNPLTQIQCFKDNDPGPQPTTMAACRAIIDHRIAVGAAPGRMISFR